MLPGLVGQQIDSFDEFIRYTIQELVYDTGEITMTPEDQYIIGQDVAQVFLHFFLFFLFVLSLFIHFFLYEKVICSFIELQIYFLFDYMLIVYSLW